MKYDTIKLILKMPDLTPEHRSVRIFSEILKPQQRKIFESIPFGRDNAVGAKELSLTVKVATKNLSNQLKALSLKCSLISSFTINKKIKYYRNDT